MSNILYHYNVFICLIECNTTMLVCVIYCITTLFICVIDCNDTILMCVIYCNNVTHSIVHATAKYSKGMLHSVCLSACLFHLSSLCPLCSPCPISHLYSPLSPLFSPLSVQKYNVVLTQHQ